MRKGAGNEVAGLAALSPPGARLSKHCRHSRPHDSYLAVDDQGHTIKWTSRKKRKDCFLRVDDITGIRLGMNTPVLMRHGKAHRANRYFSIITQDRTLDLETPTEDARNDLVAAIDFLRKHSEL